MAFPTNNVTNANSTANFFLNVNQPSWMNPGPPDQALTTKTNTTTRPNRPSKAGPAIAKVLVPRSKAGNPTPPGPSTTGDQVITDQASVLPSPALSEEGPAPTISTPLNRPQELQARSTQHVLNVQQLSNQSDSCQTHARESRHSNDNRRSLGSVRQLAIASQPPLGVLNLVKCMSDILEYLDRKGGRKNLEGAGILLPRIYLLQEACSPYGTDYTFLALHQIMCLAAAEPEGLPQTVITWSSLGPAFLILQHLLGESQVIGHGFQDYFARFPAPIHDLLTSVPMYNDELQRAVRILTAMSIHWTAFEEWHVINRKAPMITSMIDRLAVTSPVLQRIICNAIVRKTFSSTGHPDPLLCQFEAAFKNYQEEHRRDTIYRLIVNPSNTDSNTASYVDITYQAIFERIYLDFARRSAFGHVQVQYVPGLVPQVQYQRGLGTQSHQTILPSNATPELLHSGQASLRWPSTMQPQQHPTSHANPILPVLLTAGQGPGLDGFVRQSGQGRPALSHARTPLAAVPPVRASSPDKFFAKPGVAASRITPADPERFALHEAHLRGPLLRVNHDASHPGPQPLYRFIEALALKVQDFDNDVLIQEWTFELSATTFSSLLRESLSEDRVSQPSIISHDMKTLRLRCGKGNKNMQINEWITTDTDWPSHVYWRCNGSRLLPQRKLYNGRDLPIDITFCVRPGFNSIKAFSNRAPNSQDANLAIAVEVVGAQFHEDIIAACMSRILSVEDSKKELSGVLKKHEKVMPASQTTDAEDDIMITSNTLTISLLDPFRAGRMWDVPVRSRHCNHRQCFDLYVFLETRRTTNVDEPSAIDTWKCPLCNGDARPGELLIDGLLVHVKEVLEGNGQINTAKAIVVDEDGGWTTVTSGTNARQGGDSTRGRGRGTPTREVVIVELD